MIKIISPSGIKGDIKANPSKSAMQRAVAAALMADGKSVIYNPGLSNDCLAAMDVAARLGAVVRRFDDRVEITGNGIHPGAEEINCGESGLGIRMFTPIAALSDKPLTINGHGSLSSRPMDFFEEILPQLGVSCSTQEGKLPIRIKGPLQAKDITVDGSLSSQFLTGLLMAFGAAAANAVITVHQLKSRQYVALTLQVMEHFGVKVQHKDFERFIFTQKQAYRATDYTVEGDWSGGAFLLTAGAIAGEVNVANLSAQSAQPDKYILQALQDCGASLVWNSGIVTVKHAALRAFSFDATDCPDLFPPLVALAACCEGVTTIQGVDRLKHKESDRGVALQEEFGKMGIKIGLDGDIMKVYGGSRLQEATVSSHSDHRIAMACAVAALQAKGPVTITAAEAVNKSYPEFWDHLAKIGAGVNGDAH